MSGVLWRSLCIANILYDTLNRGAAGVLCVANSSLSKVLPMRIVGSATVLLPLTADPRVRNVVVRVVEDIPYGLILSADYSRSNVGGLDVAPGKGFRRLPSAP